VALDRQSIEKKDFPIGRRGYDPDAVDAHLAALAEEVEELKRSSRRRSETLASSASEQVRAIVEAAETSAAEIQRQAEEEAREIRAEASSEAQSTREQATSQAREYVGKVSESTAVMLQRLDAMESELGALIESLRTGSNRLNADLQLLEGNLSEVRDSVAPRPRFEPEELDAATAAAAAPVGEYDKAAALPEVEPEPVEELELEPVPEPAAAAEPEPALGQSEDDDGADDTEGARLIALNMALNGTPRDETDRYLAENFTLSNRAALLDEVYASVEG
jgi:DivIVA domain-containing protein